VARLARGPAGAAGGGRLTGTLDAVDALVAARTRANAAFFAAESERLARVCHRMAERFARGGRLLALGPGPAARSDARHVAVEFVHPVIVGKRALPALALTAEGGPIEDQLALAAEPEDMVMAFGGADVTVARERGCLTIAFGAAASPPPAGVAAPDESFVVDADPFVTQEVVETAYHVLWELVHVFFEHKGLLSGRAAGQVHDTGASSFLYPFLAEREDDLDAVLADVRASALAKSEEVGTLRARTLTEQRAEVWAAARVLRARLDGGGRLLALGNGGSATDAMDVVADFRDPPVAGWPRRRAIDLTEDTAILTALANDVGAELMFARQVIAHGREGDVLLALSTSGGSPNVLAALAEARRRGLETIALVGYDGGRIAEEALADHIIVVRSEHIPRIQEAQAGVYHGLRELVERV
jgi:D-sedoheptulose 7-phosphate isomerase